MYVYIDIYIYIFMYIYVYIYIHTHTHTTTHTPEPPQTANPILMTGLSMSSCSWYNFICKHVYVCVRV